MDDALWWTLCVGIVALVMIVLGCLFFHRKSIMECLVWGECFNQHKKKKKVLSLNK